MLFRSLRMCSTFSFFSFLLSQKKHEYYIYNLNKINGKMYKFIVNMYNSIKSCIVYNDNKSDFFSSEVGIRQGENL
jgi:hypothetical protein